MIRVFARIGMELLISDEEAEQLFRETGYQKYEGKKINNEFDINKEFAERFVKNGTLVDDSYIPEDCITEA